MRRGSHCLAVAVAALLAAPAAAQSVSVDDGRLVVAGPAARSAAAYFTILNSGPDDDRLVAAATDIAARVELHTHVETADGVMQMRPAPDGFEVPAGEVRILARGGDHVMVMGLLAVPAPGETVELVLSFKRAGEIVAVVPVVDAR